VVESTGNMQPKARLQTHRAGISRHPPSVTVEQVEEGWQETYNELRRLDEKMVQEYREEIDTLLVFVSPCHHLRMMFQSTNHSKGRSLLCCSHCLRRRIIYIS
jgi:hypothetical protein